MSLYLYTAETVVSVRSKIIGYAQSAGGALSNWIAGGVGFQILNTVSMTVQEFTSIAAKATRAFASLDTATDPGDLDPYDPLNQTYAAAPGGLSDVGSNFYGTERIDATEATGTITFANTGTGAVNQNLPAFSVTFQRSNANSDGTFPLYRNSAAIVCNVGVTLTNVPIVAESPGSASNATSGQVTILVTTLPGVTVTNSGPVLGLDRQPADAYRVACRQAAALTSPNGPADAYRYLATTGRDDGTYGNSTTGNSLGITKVYVSQDSTTGIVQVFYAGFAGGSAISGSVAMANKILTSTPGVISVPDAITFSGAAATDDSYNITYSLKIPASAVPGATAGTYAYPGAAGTAQATVFAAIDTAYEDLFGSATLMPIGGKDQTAGSGFVYTEDLRGVLYQIQLNAGVNLPAYAVTVTVPSGASTVVNVGHNPKYGTPTGTLTFT